MSKFKVKVKVTAACEYEAEVDTSTEAQAENTATGLWREKLPDDFQVEKGYITDWQIETEQLTATCPACNVEHPIETADRSYYIIENGQRVVRPDVEWWREDSDYCVACGAKIEAEEKVNG